MEKKVRVWSAKKARVYTYETAMSKICNTASNSPLCNNKELRNHLVNETNKYNVPIWLILWVMAHESKFGTSYHRSNTSDCRENSNNWWGMKFNWLWDKPYKKTSIWSWCWIQKFDTIQDGMTSLVRNIGVSGFKWCLQSADPVVCVSYRYVGNPTVSEHTRVNHIKTYY